MENCHRRVKLEKVLSFMVYLENSGDLYNLHHTTVRLIYTQRLSSESCGGKNVPWMGQVFCEALITPVRQDTCAHTLPQLEEGGDVVLQVPGTALNIKTKEGS